MSSSGKTKKRTSTVASRYLAAIHCPADSTMVTVQHRPLSPETFPLQQQSPPHENESFGSSKQSSIIQSRSIGNSPSSSRKSRASRTPPRDSVSRGSGNGGAGGGGGRIDSVACNSIPQLRAGGFFPATTPNNKEIDTDGSSLTNDDSRSSTPLLYEEDDAAALKLKELRAPHRFQQRGGDNALTNNWRARMDGTANYRTSKTKTSPNKASPGESPASTPRGSPESRATTTYTTNNEDEAPTEVMMNLSSIRQQQPLRRSPETMTDVTGTSTEIITNRAVDLHRKLYEADERDSTEPFARRPQHEGTVGGVPTTRRATTTTTTRRSGPQYNARRAGNNRKRTWPPPQRQRPPPQRSPIEINSLLSDTSITEEGTEESTTNTTRGAPALYPGSMPMGRLGRHVGEDKLPQNVQHQRKDSAGSFQDRSLTSSVGVETGVHAVPKSEPALKRVFKHTQPHDAIPRDPPASNQQQQQQQQQEAKDIALTRPLSPAREEEEEQGEDTNYRVPRLGEFPPRAPPSAEKSSISSNPFMVKYSARGSPPAERRGLYDIGSPQSNASSGGWTPVALSSSGMISEDFVLDPDHTPTGKDAQPITALFSADRIPSTSKSPFGNLYRPDPSNEESYDSVGPPNIHRVTANRQQQQQPVSSVRVPLAAAPDAPGAVAGDPTVERVALPGMTPDIRPLVDSPLAVSAQAAMSNVKEQSEMNHEAYHSSRSLLVNRTRRRNMLHGSRRQWPPQMDDVSQNDNDKVRDTGDAEVSPTTDKYSHEYPVQSLTATTEESTRPSVSVSRNLFPSEDNQESDETSRREEAVDGRATSTIETYVEESGDGRIEIEEARESDFRSSPSHAPSVRDRVTSFSPSKTASQQYVPPWKAKLKEQASADKATPDVANESAEQSKKQYIPPWKRKLMEKGTSSEVKREDTDETDAHGAGAETTLDNVPPWKRKQVEKGSASKAQPIDDAGKNDDGHGVSQEIKEFQSPWKLKALAPKGSASNKKQLNDGDAAVPETTRETANTNVPKWKLELMKKKGLLNQDKPADTSPITPNEYRKKQLLVERTEETTGLKRSPPKALFSVRERVNHFSPLKREESQTYVPPWVGKGRGTKEGRSNMYEPADSSAKTPSGASGTQFQNSDMVKSAPPRLSGRDRAVALSGDTNESSYISGSSSRSKRSYSERIAEERNSTSRNVLVAEESQDGESPTKAVKTSRSSRRSRVGAKLLGAVSAAQVDQSVTSGPSAEGSKINGGNAPRKSSMVLAAHLAATVDDVSPQDRYRQRFRNTDETTATDGTREASDVQSLKSFFEASIATGPSDEDSDDRTVESLRSKFEPVSENGERPNDVRRMRAMFEKSRTPDSSSKEFRGNTAVFDAFSRFNPSTPRWTPPSNEGVRRSTKAFKGSPLASPQEEAERVSSAPSKLQSRSRLARSPPPKPEDMVRVVAGKPSEGNASDTKVMSVAERIQALKLKQSPQATAKQPVLPYFVANAEATETPSPAESRPTWKKPVNKPVPTVTQASRRDSPVDDDLQRTQHAGVKTDRTASSKTRSPQAASYPSVKDRISALSGGAQQHGAYHNDDAGGFCTQSAVRGRTSWHPKDGIRSYSDRHLNTREVDGKGSAGERATQVMSIPSDEKNEKNDSDAKRSVRRDPSHASSEGTSGTGSDYDDGVTLDLSIAEISQLTNPTCIQSKADADSSSDGDDSSEHTSDVNRGSNVEGKHPSEASSSQASEAAAPLIARMKFSDDASNSVSSDKGAFPGARSRTVRNAPRWEPLTPVVDEAPVVDEYEPARQSPDGTLESAWSAHEITSTFPVEPQDGGTEKVWQPFQVENWDASPSFGSNWTPPSNADAFDTTVSEATSFGRLSENTPVRRNTSAARRAILDDAKRTPEEERSGSPAQRNGSPAQRNGSPVQRNGSPAQRSLFSRTHPSRPSAASPISVSSRSSLPFPATPRPSPEKVSSATRESAPFASGSSPTSTGISKHALLMSKLRSLKEARMRRNAATGFHRSSVYPSERPQPSRRPPTGNTSGSPPSSALAPFLRPGFVNSQTSRTNPRYPDHVAQSSPVNNVDEEQSLSTKSSTQFGGSKFVESLELD